jgi:hypothetical protein
MDDRATIPRSLDVLRSKLAQLRERDSHHVFSSETHGYGFGQCMGEEQVRAAEEESGIRFPEGYRQFLLQVGNGGVGPGFGLLTLEASVRGCPRGRLAQPFPAVFVAPVRQAPLQSLQGGDEPGDEPDDLDPLWHDSRTPDTLCQWVRYRREREPVGSSPTDGAVATAAERDDGEWHPGAMPVADYGCDMIALLVVSGPERGAIWVDDLNGSHGCQLYPLGRGGWMGQGGWRMAAHSEKRLDFLAWYDDWLDDALVQLYYDQLAEA